MSQAQSQNKPRTIVVEPFHQANSDRMLESTKDSPNPKFLKTPENLQISNTSFIVVDKATGQRRHTRYYLGCESIFLDEQQAKEKLNGDPKRKIEYRDLIFIKGSLVNVFTDEEPNRMLFKFIETHQDNTSNPNRVIPQQEDIGAFKVIDYAKEAAAEITKREQRELAWLYLNKTKTGIGENRKFHTSELNKLKSIFGITTDSNEESYQALAEIADNAAGEFVSRIEQIQTHIISDFEAAKKAGAITYKEGKYYINNEVAYIPTEKNEGKKDAEFIDFISKEEGKVVYNNMRNQTEINLLTAK